MAAYHDDRTSLTLGPVSNACLPGFSHLALRGVKSLGTGLVLSFRSQCMVASVGGEPTLLSYHWMLHLPVVGFSSLWISRRPLTVFFFHAFFRQQQGPTPTRSKHGPGLGPVQRSGRRLGPSGSGTNGSWSRSLRRNAISAAACGPAWERKSARWDCDKEGSSTWSRKKRFRVRDAQCCHPCLHSPGAAIP